MKYHYDIALSYATEDSLLADKIYHYLRAEKIKVFFAPAPEAQTVLSGRNQREIFYQIFGLEAEYVALLVSKAYVGKEVPMEEASIAISKHSEDGKVIPIYLDGTPLPETMWDPHNMNYFCSASAAEIATHLSTRIKLNRQPLSESRETVSSKNVINPQGNIAGVQFFVNTMNTHNTGES